MLSIRFYGTGEAMDVLINEYVLILSLLAILLWKPIDKGWLSELSFRGIVAKFRDRPDDKPPPRS
jgi:hypothetical protein